MLIRAITKVLCVLFLAQATLTCAAASPYDPTAAGDGSTPATLPVVETAFTEHGKGLSSPTADKHFARGLLWRVSKGANTPSYVFGTMHIEDQRVADLPDVVQEIFDRSASLTLEAKLDLASLSTVALKMVMTDGRSLEQLLEDGLYREVQSLLEGRGIPASLATVFKPWAVAVLLSTPQPKTGLFLDRKLYEQAQTQGKPIYGIESIDEQLGLFDELSITDQVSLVEEAVKRHDQLPGLIEEITRAYLQRDLRALVELSEFHLSSDETIARQIRRRLIVERNIKMVERMLPQLSEGSAFIAIGALHLPGDDGILQLLLNRGFQVTAIY